MQARFAPSCTGRDKDPHCNIPIESQRVRTPKLSNSQLYLLLHSRINKNNALHIILSCQLCVVSVVWHVAMRVLWQIGIIQQPARVMGSCTYPHVAGTNEKLSLWFPMDLERVKYRENANVNGVTAVQPILRCTL